VGASIVAVFNVEVETILVCIVCMGTVETRFVACIIGAALSTKAGYGAPLSIWIDP